MRYVPGATPRMTKCPRESARATRSIGILRNAESAISAYRPTSIPFTGSRSSACTTYPDTSNVSISSPVEKLYV